MTLALQKPLGITVLAILFATIAAFLPLAASAHSDSNSNSVSGTRAEVVMTADGKVLVRGAKVTGISGSTVNASVVLGSQTLTWVLNTNADTDFVNARGGESTLEQLAVNDIVSFAGTLSSAGSPFSVTATAVKDWTPVASEGKVSGLITSIDTANSKLVIDKRNGKGDAKTVTVQFNASTTVTLNGAASSFANLQVNDGLKVVGTLSADGATITAVSAQATRPAQIEDKKFSKMLKVWFSGKDFFRF